MAKLSYKDLRVYLDDLFEKLSEEARFFNESGNLNMFINKYQFEDDNNKSSTISEDAKVLILGIGNGLKEKDITGIFKEAKLKDDFECINIENLTNFDFSNLEHSIKYSDVFVGSIPHKVRGIKDANNPVEYLEENSEGLYPKIHVLRTSNKLKITKSNLREAIATSLKFQLANL
ncbi:hypothetical protein GCM10007358_17570 [Phocicoccus schoeneichii]|uniref:Uncharacterized protein n=1 Tax=Phocicoccus schoeneichii TaxID=1812261 RepID=A0A6V7RP44_9BACL|nr:hypothetical protein [Jeotgalicoccus schoeneichii]GGH55844.1 hypothetical protein GCM10007358_17570 [Jeotgalicoccus schoeneichii]CAD2079331.1 hypothetical protein JEOSCH030_01610 [Jeotgalicoccus schoeneichii]